MSDETKTGGWCDDGWRPGMHEEVATPSPWARYCDLEVDGRLVESFGDALLDDDGAKLEAWCAEVAADFAKKLLAYIKER